MRQQAAGGQIDAQVDPLVDLDRVGQIDAGGDVERLAALCGRNGPGEGGRLIDLAGGVAEESPRVDDVGRHRRAGVLLGPIYDQAKRGQVVNLDDEISRLASIEVEPQDAPLGAGLDGAAGRMDRETADRFRGRQLNPQLAVAGQVRI